ncbi:hypothetical protein [Aurantimonas marina]|uniref:hypothetical protein n=1 Tax=Aurantimonas marina TaxID=2780508 RepID=UPI0019D0D2FA|nr:hypothetical protein [Aurantimonas marina]
MGFFIRIILGAVALLFVAPFAAMLAEPFFAAFLSEMGIDTALWGRPVAMLISQLWFQLLAAGATGAAMGTWLHWGATRYDRKKTPILTQTERAARSVLRLRFSGRTEAPTAVFEENIASWFAYWSPSARIHDQHGKPLLEVPASWALFIVFEREVDYRQATVSASGASVEHWEIRQGLPSSLVVTFAQTLPPCDVEIATKL